MKLLDLKSFTDYVEAALPVFPKKWRIEESRWLLWGVQSGRLRAAASAGPGSL